MEKIVPIETLVSMFEEPSSGSMAIASGAILVEQHRLLKLFRRVERDRRMAHGVEKDIVGENVEVLLGVAVGIGAAVRAAGGGAERALVDSVADSDRGARQLLDGFDDRGANGRRRPGQMSSETRRAWPWPLISS